MNSNLPSLKVIRRSFSGFTLIELLVVITIIAILAAILFPVFARAREKARQSACLSNEKQIGTAVMQYTQDFDETLPQQRGSSNSSNQAKWIDNIYPYINSVQVFTCPSSVAANTNKSDNVFQPNIALRTGNNQDDFGSYGCNVSYFSGSGTVAVTATPPFPFGKSTTLAQMPVPAATILMTERWLRPATNTSNASIGWGTGATNPNYDTTTSNIPSLIVAGGTGQIVPFLHSGGVNVIWADGHVKWMTPGDMLSFRHYGSKDILYYWTIEED